MMEGTMMNTSDIISLQMEQSFTRLANVPTAPHTDYAAARQRTIDEMLNSDTSGIYLEIEENKINPKGAPYSTLWHSRSMLDGTLDGTQPKDAYCINETR